MYRPAFYLAIILASLLPSMIPEWASAFIFDRRAVFSGEIWRIFTGHFVHFSYTHLAYNLIAFCVVSYVIERKKYPNLYLLYFFLSLLISTSLIILKPGMTYYGGLSGIVYGFLYYCALMGIKDPRPWQTICILTLLFLPIKIAAEIYNSTPALLHFENQLFIPMQTSHITGCLAAVFFYFMTKTKQALINHPTNTKRLDSLPSPPALAR
ncbi:rhombosortase [Microbulbifer sp. 2304DJ12-6]|uniref:rhombosortase n=1 Tax=Microbulbifer sp. 2304DJ12-6 TaxID=3233340 RepID=UPI0039B00892